MVTRSRCFATAMARWNPWGHWHVARHDRTNPVDHGGRSRARRSFVFFTGLTDAPAEEAVSVDELADLLNVLGGQSIEDLVDSIRALERARRPHGSGDDTALLILRIDGSGTFSETREPQSAGQPATSGGSR